MTDAPDARRRPTLLQRLAGLPWPARIGLEFVACTAALLSLAWATGYLPDEASAPRERITVARVDDWPEIKNGIPEVRPARPAAPQALIAARPLKSATEAEAPARTSGAPALASIGSPGLLEPRSTYAAPVLGSAAPAPASIEPTALPGAELSPASVSAAPEPVELASTEEPRPIQPANVPAVGAAEPRQDGADRAPPESRDVQPARVSVPDRPSAAPPAADPRTKKKAEAKPATRPERKRTASAAAAPQEVPAAPEPPAIEARPDDAGERTTVLGVPVPSGRKIKECLLEFRC